MKVKWTGSNTARCPTQAWGKGNNVSVTVGKYKQKTTNHNGSTQVTIDESSWPITRRLEPTTYKQQNDETIPYIQSLTESSLGGICTKPIWKRNTGSVCLTDQWDMQVMALRTGVRHLPPVETVYWLDITRHYQQSVEVKWPKWLPSSEQASEYRGRLHLNKAMTTNGSHRSITIWRFGQWWSESAECWSRRKSLKVHTAGPTIPPDGYSQLTNCGTSCRALFLPIYLLFKNSQSRIKEGYYREDNPTELEGCWVYRL